jgi:hypothetical protein
MQMTSRDKKILTVAWIVITLLLVAYFVFLRPDGGEDVAIPESPTGPTGGLPTATRAHRRPGHPRDATCRR